jgi:alpha-methylacyl-CoA racemase
MGPLAGVKVIEIAGIGPGPVAGMMLADLGAEVVLIERQGDNPNAAQVGDLSKGGIYKRGKRSIELDLKDPAHVEVVLALAAKADLMLEGFRPGVVERLGIGPDACLARNPRLVYGRITGWGQTGPLAQAAGHDLNYLSITGAVHYSGLAGDTPYPPPTIVGDVSAGSLPLVIGLLAGYAHAVRTGRGQVVDAAICDGAIYNMTLLADFVALGGLSPERGGDFVTGGAHWGQTYACADGRYISVQALEPNFYQQLLVLCGLEGDPDFARQHDARTWPRAKIRLAELFAQKTRDEWCELLEGSDACFAPVLSMQEATEHHHNRARNNFIEAEGMVQPAPAPKFSATRQEIGSVPRPGQHNREILESLELAPELRAALMADGFA